jgi:HlyD family secretion protein
MRDDALPSLRRLALASLAVVVLGLGGLVGWAAAARVETAVPAGGSIVSQGKRKTVSLLDGGILRSLLAQEGDRVAAGQTLLLLEDAQARALMEQAQIRLVAAEARLVRLHAELEDRRDFRFPESIAALAPAAVTRPLLAAEAALFATRWEAHEGAIGLRHTRIAQLRQQMAAHQAQARAHATRLRLVQQELAGVQELLARGFAPRIRALDLQRTVAMHEGEIGELEARAAEAAQVIVQTELEILNLHAERRNAAAQEIQDAVAQVADGRSRLAAAEELLRRTVVTAPEDGVVTELRFFTPGSSVVAGQPVLDIVPALDELLVEAAVNPAEIERVALGQRVNVRLTAFPHRRVPPLPGTLVYVGADRQVNTRGEPFFLVRARLAAEAVATLPSGVTISPGMPADVLIIGAARSPLDYVASPLLDGMRRALRED